MKNICIKIENLKREFNVGGEIVRALRGVSFSIYEGEFVTIMGASGSGKSTLLNILGCLDKPTAGKYELDGVELQKLNKDELATIRNTKIGFIFQSYNLLARTSALENIELPLFYNHSISHEERRERALKCVELVGLQQRMYHTPAQLSGGQQQRVATARALINDPVVILADEATGNLDTRTSYEIMGLFQTLNKQGKTIVFVTHEPDIAQMSSRTITLKDGLVVKDEINPNPIDALAMLTALPKEDDMG
ncbi:MAG: ABC transporter ATP-binding protein [Bacteroidetes bacterium]|nr:ABC transporter ATP-binding protein [Bacteroidota bacterium]